MARFLKFVVNLIIVSAILVAGAILIPPLVGIDTIIVDSFDMDTNLPVGSATYASSKDINDIKTDDQILIREEGATYIYTVEDVDVAAGEARVTDAIYSGQGSITRSTGDKVSKVFITIPYIGFVVMAVQSIEGLIVVGLIVLFVIILFVIAEMWKKGDEHEADAKKAANFWDNGTDSDNLKKSKKKSKKKRRRGGFIDEDDEPILEGMPARHTMEYFEDVGNGAVERAIGTDLASGIIEQATGELAHSIAEMSNSSSEQAPPVTEPYYGTETVQIGGDIVLPQRTAEEILEDAMQRGDNPKVVKDTDSGVTLIDYSETISKKDGL